MIFHVIISKTNILEHLVWGTAPYETCFSLVISKPEVWHWSNILQVEGQKDFSANDAYPFPHSWRIDQNSQEKPKLGLKEGLIHLDVVLEQLLPQFWHGIALDQSYLRYLKRLQHFSANWYRWTKIQKSYSRTDGTDGCSHKLQVGFVWTSPKAKYAWRKYTNFVFG